MVFNEDSHAVDWIFRYGNAALAKLEKLPLEQLIGSSFGSLFSNMDSKWLRSYERATLYGEKREIIDYSPEIEFTRDSSDAEKALMLYFGKLPDKNS